jgi:hypothetical protein
LATECVVCGRHHVERAVAVQVAGREEPPEPDREARRRAERSVARAEADLEPGRVDDEHVAALIAVHVGDRHGPGVEARRVGQERRREARRGGRDRGGREQSAGGGEERWESHGLPG